jgi:hypothetical protein
MKSGCKLKLEQSHRALMKKLEIYATQPQSLRALDYFTGASSSRLNGKAVLLLNAFWKSSTFLAQQ